MICASTSYAFNLFSGSLRDKYNFDSRQMSTINTVGMVFAYFLLPYGTIYDYLGPLPVYILACVLASLGLLLMGLTFHDVIGGSVVRRRAGLLIYSRKRSSLSPPLPLSFSR